jgi:hypothetical protein
VPPIANASEAGVSENSSMVRPGSGMIAAAPIAVKWCETIANASSAAAAVEWPKSSWRTASVSAALPNSTPSAIEAMTRSDDHAMWPGTSSAHMPR